MDFATTAAVERTAQLKAGLDQSGADLDQEIARYNRRARRLHAWDLAVRVAVTVLAIAAPVVVAVTTLLPGAAPWWAIGITAAASAAVVLERTLALHQRFVIVRTVSGRIAQLRRLTEFDLSDLPATHSEYHDALRRRLWQLLDGQVDVAGEQARAEMGAIWRIDGLG